VDSLLLLNPAQEKSRGRIKNQRRGLPRFINFLDKGLGSSYQPKRASRFCGFNNNFMPRKLDQKDNEDGDHQDQDDNSQGIIAPHHQLI